MSQSIRNTSPVLSNAVFENLRSTVLQSAGLARSLLYFTNELNLQLVNKKFNHLAQSITQKNWTDLQRLAGVNSPSGPTEFQKRHPTLSSFIRSGQIADYAQLITYLRNEAQVLEVTNSREYRTFRSSIIKGDILALDRLIEQTNYDRANGDDNYLWSLFGTDVGLPEIRNYETWNETVRSVDRSGIIKLDLFYRGLTRIPFGVFQLQALRSLHLYGNRLAFLPREIGQLQALRSLSLYTNHLAALPREIGRLRALNRLDLQGNQLTSLPREIGQLRALTRLYLLGNRLDRLPQEIGQLQALRWLNLGYNQLTSLPQGIVQLRALQSLSIRRNEIAALPQEIGQLRALQLLYLTHNNLASLPREIGQLQALQELDLQGNQLTSLPREIGQLRALTRLYLLGNRLARLPREIGQLQALQGLYFDSGQLAVLPESFAKLLPQLEPQSREDVRKLVEAGRRAQEAERKDCSKQPRLKH